MKIGIFDSGVGGKSVANVIIEALPDVEILYAEDHKNLPYGNKTPQELLNLVLPILNMLSISGAEIIVIACNTVSTNIITELRRNIDIPLVALEPMIKPATKLSKTGVITVCATPATLKSPRYNYLKKEYGIDKKFIEPDCSDWASLIEQGEIEGAKIKKIIDDCLAQNSDVIVLGCTHYHWISDYIQSLCNDKAKVLEPEDAVIKQLKKVIEQLS